MRSDRRPAKDPQGVDGFTTLLRQAGVDFGAEDLADALWLAQFVDGPGEDEALQADDSNKDQKSPTVREEYLEPEEDLDEDNQAQLSLPSTHRQTQGAEKPDGISIKAPAAPALRIRLDLSRALRPLRRRVNSPGRLIFDEAATVDQIADQQIWSPVMRPAPERWLDVALVVEEAQALSVWNETIIEVQTLLERQGTFRRVTTWRLKKHSGKLALFQHWQRPGPRPRQAKELWDPSKRRLIILLSDCTSTTWHDGAMVSWLQTCGQRAPTVLMQLLPERLWSQTGLGAGVPVWLRAIEPGCVNERLTLAHRLPIYKQLLAGVEQKNRVKLPVVTLQAQTLKQWAKVLAGRSESWATGIVFDNEKKREETGENRQDTERPEPAARVQRFRTTASLMAQELAELMSVAPVSPPIVDLIRQTLLPKAEPVHVAEVYMGGLMEPSESDEKGEVSYDFDDEVRKLLANSVPRSVSKRVLNAVSAYISERLNLNTRSFEALLSVDFGDDADAEGMVVPFARVAEQTLRRMGREYAAIADRIQTRPKVPLHSVEGDASDWMPLLQTFTFREATVSFEAQSKTTLENILEVSEAATLVKDQVLELTKPFKHQRNVKRILNSDDLWHLEAIGLKRARENGFSYTGKGVTVAVISSGIDSEHPELAGKIVEGYEYSAENSRFEKVSTSLDSDGIGTATAGLICGDQLGVAPDVRLVSISILSQQGTGTLSAFIQALQLVSVNPEISIVCIGVGFQDTTATATELLQQSMHDLISVGVLPICSIGNDGRYHSLSPGNFRSVISVGSSNREGRISSFSGSGDIVIDNHSYQVPSVVAPGEGVYSCVVSGGYEAWDGTSIAAAIVTGIAALILEANPSVDVFELRENVLERCVELSVADESQKAKLFQV
ncbi:S8/S53 family peptidase [Adonisia turfae]|uniref:Peptidase S8/S53 domain-containing protein n=1 Tax=Adonisia turfae CCMR0081 TaxID=2292702 RepID=A0A6M0RDB4_9CYAN|nr:S8/S53 family peptidase [Adonisia turfae]NEZ54308.1 hypothetical protein [Adonisia turfae CCMR0081]